MFTVASYSIQSWRLTLNDRPPVIRDGLAQDRLPPRLVANVFQWWQRLSMVASVFQWWPASFNAEQRLSISAPHPFTCQYT